MTTFTIEIVSDPICPWCYIGLRRLQKAISTFQKTYPGGSKDVFKIVWKPYYLHPEAPDLGLPMKERMIERMGIKRAEDVQKHMERVGSAEGIRFDYGARTGNSRLAHLLLHYAGAKSWETQTYVAEELFRGHFEERKEIADMEFLLDVAGRAGLGKEEVRRDLEQGRGKAEVDEEEKKVRETCLKGVPQFLIDGEKRFEGAEDVGEFFEAFVRIKESGSKGERE